jgi:hypothetical protein
VDLGRLPDVTTVPARGSRSARHSPGGLRRVAPIAAVLTLIAGCIATGPPESTPPPASRTAAATSRPTATPDAEPSSPPGSPTPIPDPEPPVAVPLRSITVICESWGAEPPPATIDCAHAVTASLAALGGERAAVVRRIDVGYGEWCDDPSACVRRQADVGWVVARTATLETLRVRVALDSAGGLQAWPPVPGPRVILPTFQPPPIGAPDLGGGTPPRLATREPFPFCGSEDVGLSETFNTAARQCFVDGVQAGSPVEMISRTGATEGGAVLNVYRFAGEGAVLRYLLKDGRWSAAACGISPIATTAAFVLAGTCESLLL